MLRDPFSSDGIISPSEKAEPGMSALQLPLVANLMAIGSLVLGILSILRLSLFSGVLAIVLGCLSRKNCTKSGIATGGIWCGGIGIALILLLVLLFSNAGPPSYP